MASWLQILDSATWRDSDDAPRRVALCAGEVLFRQGDTGGAMYVVVAGTLQAVAVHDDGSETVLGEMRPGDTVGEVQFLTGGERTATVRAAEASELVELDAEDFRRLVEGSPETLAQMVALTRQRLDRSLLATVLPELFGPLDEETLDYLESRAEWVHLHGGDKLFEQGDAGDDLYVILSGRLAAVVPGDDGREQMLGEMARGECLGEMALLTGEPRTTAVRALRDSLLVAFSKESFENIADRFPGVLFNVARILVRRLAKASIAPSVDGGAGTVVALLPADGDVPAGELARRLTLALSSSGPALSGEIGGRKTALHLGREHLENLFGAGVMDEDDETAQARLSEWLDSQELRFRSLVYEAEPTATAWTRRCLRQADHVLLVVRTGSSPETGRLRELLASAGRDDLSDRTTLVLLHPDARRRPRGTGRLLAALGLGRHHHLRWNEPGEFRRLARFLEGRAVGLTLGGGGARGYAHIGVIRALEEAGIPIDMVGGTSMGCLLAAQYALCGDPEAMVEINRSFIAAKPQRDFTLPVFSILSTRRPMRLFTEIFGDVEIEDLWIPYFAVSANLTTARQVIHRSGRVTKSIRASMSVPGAWAPMLDGHELLVDGGTLNNLPGDVMRELGGGRVILVDVSPQSDLSVADAGDRLPSPWKVLWSRLNPLAKKIEVPGMIEILVRSSTLACTRDAELAKSRADLYLAPPVERFGMFELSAFDALVEIGYRHTLEEIREWDGPRSERS